MTDKEKIKELEEKLAKYEGLPHAKFYTALLEGVEHITKQIKNKSLDFDSDPFAKNIFLLAKDAEKIMASLEKGSSFFIIQEKVATTKKAEKSNTRAI
jgi:hypothetical protein